MSPVEQMDAASLQVLISRLEGIAEEMGAVLQRSAYSPNIKERADCSAAVFTASGELLAQAEHIPVHLGSMPASVAAVIDAVASEVVGGEAVGGAVSDGGGDLSGRVVLAGLAGDGAAGGRAVDDGVGSGGFKADSQYVVNDPFAGGTHLNDITLVAPCVVGGRLVGWVANRAHHADVGGSAPGSLPADAVEIFAEGLRLPPLRFTEEVRALVLANSRTPEERSGDLDAQVGANRVGVERLAGLVARLLDRDAAGSGGGGASGRVSAFEAVLAYGERRMRAVLGELADGVWRFQDVLDSTGPTDEQQRSAHLEVTVTVAGDGIEVDFTGTDAQRRGNVNAVEAVTVSAVAYALRVALDPSLPSNGGVLRPVSIVAPAGTLVNAQPPVAVGAGNVEVSQRIAELCLGAMAGPCAGRVGAAGQGTMNNLLIGGHGDDAWVYYETVGGGQGGGPTGAGQSGVHTGMTNTSQAATDQPGPGTPGMSGIHACMTNTVDEGHQSAAGVPGQSGIHTNMTNTKNTPIEALERAFPMRVLRQRLRRGSGGAGWSAGGEGIERDLQVLVDATVSLITERRVSQPWGLAGGEPGAVGENWLLPGGDEARAERLPDKCTIQLKAGDVLRMLTPGGGGWGPPTSNDL